MVKEAPDLMAVAMATIMGFLDFKVLGLVLETPQDQTPSEQAVEVLDLGVVGARDTEIIVLGMGIKGLGAVTQGLGLTMT